MPAAEAPSAGVTIVDTGPPSPPPAPTQTIRVSQMPQPATPAAEPKRGSAMDRLKADLAKKAKPSSFESTAATPPAAAPAPPVSPPEAYTEGEGSQDNAPEPSSSTTEGQTPPAATEKGKKPSPWKLMDEFKARAAALEKELLETKAKILPEADRDAMTKRLTEAEKRAKEYEEEIRYRAYEKHPEFIEKFEKPYEQAWQRAMSELSELHIDDGKGGKRAVVPDDLFQLTAMPLEQAREVAEQAFGAFADDVMGYRKEIKNLFAAKQQALKDAREKGAERDKLMVQQQTEQKQVVSKFVKETWDKVNAGLLADEKIGTYFKPKEGNKEWNERLAKGTELVARAFNERPDDPSLTPEQRASIVKRHAAVWNRAASWGALRHENETLMTALAEMKKELDSYKGSQPPTGGSIPAPGTTAEGGTAMERMLNELRKRAK